MHPFPSHLDKNIEPVASPQDPTLSLESVATTISYEDIFPMLVLHTKNLENCHQTTLRIN